VERVEERVDRRTRETRESGEPLVKLHLQGRQVGSARLEFERPEKGELLRFVQITEFREEKLPRAGVSLVLSIPEHIIECGGLSNSFLDLRKKLRQRRTPLIPIRPGTTVRDEYALDVAARRSFRSPCTRQGAEQRGTAILVHSDQVAKCERVAAS
jgi:hypothetical protein